MTASSALNPLLSEGREAVCRISKAPKQFPFASEGVAGRGTVVSTSSNLTRPDGVVLAKEILPPLTSATLIRGHYPVGGRNLWCLPIARRRPPPPGRRPSVLRQRRGFSTLLSAADDRLLGKIANKKSHINCGIFLAHVQSDFTCQHTSLYNFRIL